MCSWSGFVLLGGLCSDFHTIRPRWYLQMFLHLLVWSKISFCGIPQCCALNLTWHFQGEWMYQKQYQPLLCAIWSFIFCLKIGFKMVNNHIFLDVRDYKICTTCWIKSANCSIPMLKTSILLHTAYCLKINERNYSIPHSILIFHPEHNEMCREILMPLEGFLIQGVVWHSCTASWDRQDRPSSPGISGAPGGMNSTAASEARSQAQILDHIADLHLQNPGGRRRKPPRIPAVSFTRKPTLKSAVNYSVTFVWRFTAPSS